MVKRNRHKDSADRSKAPTQFRLIRTTEENEDQPSVIRFTARQMFVSLVGFSFIVFIASFFLISNTSLREYIPGVPSSKIKKELIELNQQLDSIAVLAETNEQYYRNISHILNDADTVLPEENYSGLLKGDDPNLEKSNRNEAFIEKIETREKFNTSDIAKSSENLKNRAFFVPVKGALITDKFNPEEKHYGVDLVASTNEPIKSVLNGTVIFADWTTDNGYVIAIQHKDNLISVYKHNSSLLKKSGDYVRFGEVISIIGNSGKLSHGPHLHFELWYNGHPIDPEGAILF